MKLLSVAACIFLLATIACGEEVPAKKDVDSAPAKKDSPTSVQDTPTDKVTSEAEAEDEADDGPETEDAVESDDKEVDDIKEIEADQEEDKYSADQEVDDMEVADKVKDAKAKPWWDLFRRRRRYVLVLRRGCRRRACPYSKYF